SCDHLLLGDSLGQLSGEDPLEDDVGRLAEHLRPDHREDDTDRSQQDDEDDADALRAQTADEALGRGTERHRLLGRHAGAAERATTSRSAARGRSRPSGCLGLSFGLGFVVAHAAASALSWLSTISRYSAELDSSSSWVPRPTIVP